ncbi:MAG TPA: glycosyltransferase family 4 protein [Paludibacter sp.]
MAKILIVSTIFRPEPLVQSVIALDLANDLAKKHVVVVICPVPSRPAGLELIKCEDSYLFKVVRLTSFTYPKSKLFGRLRESFSFGKHCVNYIRKHKNEIDCIYVNAWPLFAQYQIAKEARRLNIPYAVHVQDIYPESLLEKLPSLFSKLASYLLLPIDTFVLRNATKIVGISNGMNDYLSISRKVDIKKFQEVRNWQEDKFFIDFIPQKATKHEFVFMYLGSVSRSAGVETLIYAFYKANLSKAKLIIAGNGSDKAKCEEIVSKLGNKQIEFCDVLPEDVPKIQSYSDVLLLPLKVGIALTATPSKLTAYMLSGRPVIAGVEKGSDVDAIISEGNFGYIVEPENVDALAACMKNVYNLPKAKLEEFGKNANSYGIMNFTKDVNLRKLTKVIEELIN